MPDDISTYSPDQPVPSPQPQSDAMGVAQPIPSPNDSRPAELPIPDPAPVNPQPITPTDHEAVPPQTEVPLPTSSSINGPLPDEFKGISFNWGAFIFTWIWGFNHKVIVPSVIGLLAPIVLIGGQLIALFLLLTVHPSLLLSLGFFLVLINLLYLCLPFWFGFKGNRWAWQHRHFNSLEEFKAIQSRWTLAGLILILAFLVFGVLSVALRAK